LDDALKEEFKNEEQKQGDVGKQFNETVSRDEVCLTVANSFYLAMFAACSNVRAVLVQMMLIYF
jgi:hypothetical protein